MIGLGQWCLLGAFVASGYASFACILGSQQRNGRLVQSGVFAGLANALLLTSCMVLLLHGLYVRDFRIAYVAQYTNRSLPWEYALASLWVGQAGSMLLWSWLTAALSMLFWWWPRRNRIPVLTPAWGIVLGFCFFLNSIMVFTADPMAASAGPPGDGAGLSPILQHPAMLIHPPIVFLAYSFWAIPCALALAGLARRQLDSAWLAESRPWILISWVLLGTGILWGARWAYMELGWGGYWGWDPVENGSLMPWLLGTATMHCFMAWRFRGMLKKTALCLMMATFGMCIFATFLTRSGIFSSLHAFSKSPIGWLFLILLGLLLVAGTFLIVSRCSYLQSERRINSLWSRESIIMLSTIGLSMLTGVILFGTLAPVLAELTIGRKVVFGVQIYNQALVPTALFVVGACGLSPLLRWGKRPSALQVRIMLAGFFGSALISLTVSSDNAAPLLWRIMTGLVALGCFAILGAWYLETARAPGSFWWAALAVLRRHRQRYAGFVTHVGFFCLALGILASSLGNHHDDVALRVGERYTWRNREIQLERLSETTTPGKLVAAAHLTVYDKDQATVVLEPAQQFHLSHREWTTEVAIDSNWTRDLYVILHGADESEVARFTLIENPMVRWIWFGGLVMSLGAVSAAWPTRRHRLGRSQTVNETIVGAEIRHSPAASENENSPNHRWAA